jgi:hypothetical protein
MNTQPSAGDLAAMLREMIAVYREDHGGDIRQESQPDVIARAMQMVRSWEVVPTDGADDRAYQAYKAFRNNPTDEATFEWIRLSDGATAAWRRVAAALSNNERAGVDAKAAHIQGYLASDQH